MRIISSFTDYYDSVQKYDTNSDIIFERNELEFNTDTKSNVINKLISLMLSESKSKYSSYNIWSYPHTNNSIVPITIVFAGEIYSGIEMRIDKKFLRSCYFFYSIDDVDNCLDENKLLPKDFSCSRSELNNLFTIKKIDRDFLIGHKISIATKCGETITINGNLGDFQFYKVLDAYTAYQRLEQWVSGILAYPPNVMIDIEDKYKIAAHGFDEKYGFRTRPTNKKTRNIT